MGSQGLLSAKEQVEVLQPGKEGDGNDASHQMADETSLQVCPDFLRVDPRKNCKNCATCASGLPSLTKLAFFQVQLDEAKLAKQKQAEENSQLAVQGGWLVRTLVSGFHISTACQNRFLIPV